MFEADRRLAGYAWYDELPRLTDVNTHIEIDGAAYTERELRRQFRAARYGDGAFDPRNRATRIVTTVSVARPDGTQDTNRYMADIALLDKEFDLLSDPPPVITAGSTSPPMNSLNSCDAPTSAHRTIQRRTATRAKAISSTMPRCTSL